MCILVPTPLFLYLVPYLYQFSAVKYISEIFVVVAILDKCSIIIRNNGARTACSYGAVWEKFNEQHQLQSTIFNAQFALFQKMIFNTFKSVSLNMDAIKGFTLAVH